MGNNPQGVIESETKRLKAVADYNSYDNCSGIDSLCHYIVLLLMVYCHGLIFSHGIVVPTDDSKKMGKRI